MKIGSAQTNNVFSAVITSVPEKKPQKQSGKGLFSSRKVVKSTECGVEPSGMAKAKRHAAFFHRKTNKKQDVFQSFSSQKTQKPVENALHRKSKKLAEQEDDIILKVALKTGVLSNRTNTKRLSAKQLLQKWKNKKETMVSKNGVQKKHINKEAIKAFFVNTKKKFSNLSKELPMAPRTGGFTLMSVGEKSFVEQMEEQKHRYMQEMGYMTNTDFQALQEEISLFDTPQEIQAHEIAPFVGTEVYKPGSKALNTRDIDNLLVLLNEESIGRKGKFSDTDKLAIRKDKRTILDKQISEEAAGVNIAFGARKEVPAIFNISNLYDALRAACYSKAAAFTCAILSSELNDNEQPEWLLNFKKPFENEIERHKAIVTQLGEKEDSGVGSLRFGRLFSGRPGGEYNNIEIIQSLGGLAYATVINPKGLSVEENTNKVKEVLNELTKKVDSKQPKLIMLDRVADNTKGNIGEEEVMNTISEVKDYRPISCTIGYRDKGCLGHTETLFFDKSTNSWWGNVDGEVRSLGSTLKSSIKTLNKIVGYDMFAVRNVLLEHDSPLERFQKKNDFYTTSTLNLVKGSFIVNKQKDGTLLMQKVEKNKDGKEYVSQVIHMHPVLEGLDTELREGMIWKYDQQGKLVESMEFHGENRWLKRNYDVYGDIVDSSEQYSEFPSFFTKEERLRLSQL